jgi:hypothetical protein
VGGREFGGILPKKQPRESVSGQNLKAGFLEYEARVITSSSFVQIPS